MSRRVALVTDSTVSLPPSLAVRHGIESVALHVLVGEQEFVEGVDITTADVAARLRKGPRVSTSRPAPQAFLDTYERLAAAGAQDIVSVHLSAALSGTCDAARLGARHAPARVTVVDSASAALGLGFAVLAAARALEAGADAGEAARVAHTRAQHSTVLFFVNSLEHLRRGGRLGAASAFLGSALAVKPLLALADGHVEPVEKLRTTGRAMARMVDLAAHAAEVAEAPVEVGVQHVDAPDRAAELTDRLMARLDEGGRVTGVAPLVVDLPAALAVHAGPGALGIVVAPAY